MKQARGFNRLLVIGFLFLWLVQGSTLLLTNADEHLRRFTRAYEFDFSIWMLDALRIKFAQAALDAPNYLSEAEQAALVKDYLAKIAKLNKLKADIEWLYTPPTVADPTIASKPLVRDQLQVQAELKQLPSSLHRQSDSAGSSTQE